MITNLSGICDVHCVTRIRVRNYRKLSWRLQDIFATDLCKLLLAHLLLKSRQSEKESCVYLILCIACCQDGFCYSIRIGVLPAAPALNDLIPLPMNSVVNSLSTDVSKDRINPITDSIECRQDTFYLFVRKKPWLLENGDSRATTAYTVTAIIFNATV